MLDLNHILLFLACVSPVVVLLRTARRARQARTWQMAAVAVLIVTGLAYILAPAHAGFVGGGAWLLLLFVPSFGLRKVARLTAQERFGAARRLVSLVRLVHPSANLRDEHRLLSALALAHRGKREAALDLLGRLARAHTPAARRAIAHSFRLRGDWLGLLEWCRANVARAGIGDDPMLLLLYFRALGELGLRDELVVQFAGRAPVLLASPLSETTYVVALLMVLAFCGRRTAVARLLKRLRQMPRDVKTFWLARSESAAGAPPLSAPNEATVARFERETLRPRGSLVAPTFGGITPAVLVIVVLNALMFVAEIALGGAADFLALHRLGALEPALVLSGQYWRLLAALFLHASLLHLSVNLYALYVLGTALENAIGSLRFAACYLLAGLGSGAGVVLLARLGLTKADLLVGASGAVMGVVGAWAAFLAGHRHLPAARQRLLMIALLVLVQTLVDVYTPQISIAAHLCGLLSGVLVGFALAPPREL